MIRLRRVFRFHEARQRVDTSWRDREGGATSGSRHPHGIHPPIRRAATELDGDRAGAATERGRRSKRDPNLADRSGAAPESTVTASDQKEALMSALDVALDPATVVVAVDPGKATKGVWVSDGLELLEDPASLPVARVRIEQREAMALDCRYGERWCQADSVKRRRAWPLPVLVIGSCERDWPEECSVRTRPTNEPIERLVNRCQSPSSTASANASPARQRCTPPGQPRRAGRRGVVVGVTTMVAILTVPPGSRTSEALVRPRTAPKDATTGVRPQEARAGRWTFLASGRSTARVGPLSAGLSMLPSLSRFLCKPVGMGG